MESQVAGKRSPHENRMMSVCTTRAHLRWTYEFYTSNNNPHDQREEQGTGRPKKPRATLFQVPEVKQGWFGSMRPANSPFVQGRMAKVRTRT